MELDMPPPYDGKDSFALIEVETPPPYDGKGSPKAGCDEMIVEAPTTGVFKHNEIV